MESEQLANSIEAAIAVRLENYNDSIVTRFTPSIIVGRRYIGFAQGGKSFGIEVNVKELED